MNVSFKIDFQSTGIVIIIIIFNMINNEIKQ